jgi:hypothetical protein
MNINKNKKINSIPNNKTDFSFIYRDNSVVKPNLIF